MGAYGTFRDAITRALQMVRGYFSGRDYDEALGYPTVVTPEMLEKEIESDPIAGRIASAYPDACFKVPPTIAADEAFLSSWAVVNDRIDLWDAMYQADLNTGMGYFGIVVFGLADGRKLEDPVDPTRVSRLEYVRSFPQSCVKIQKWDTDARSRRFGSPVLYQVTIRSDSAEGGSASVRTQTIHHSRVLHIAEGATSSMYIGRNRVRRVFNVLINLKKLTGGGAEIYWQNAAAQYHINADKDADLGEEDVEKLKDQVRNMQAGLSRYMTTQGVTVDQLAPGLMGSDPSTQINTNVQLASAGSGIPKRIIMGSEAGELASSQDGDNWGERVTERSKKHVLPKIILPFIKRLMEYGVLKGRFIKAEWDEADNLTESARAAIAVQKAQALNTYSNTVDPESKVSVAEFRAWLGLKGSSPIEDRHNDTAAWDSDDVEDGLLDEEDPEVADEFARMKANQQAIL